VVGYVFHTPVSHDAPIEAVDARFWDWAVAGLLVVVLATLVVWLVTALV